MTEATTASPALILFTRAFEGTVHRAYRDAGGVVTIGNGFTGLSKTFATWWRAHRGHALRMGDTITDAECDLLLGLLIAAEYAPPVAKRFAGTGIRQHAFDAATDVSFNCGQGSLKWSWAKLLASGAMTQAAARLKTTAVTAGGRRLKGLERRRAAEARLLETGDYGAGTTPVAADAADVAACQRQLAALGLYAGAVDGIAGPATQKAVNAFQEASDLVVDGIVGPATRAALARAVAARRAGQAAGGGAATAAATGGGAEAVGQAGTIDGSTLVAALAWGAVIGAILLAGFLIWHFRGVILRRRIAA